ncbi:MAG: hypothetical protein R3F37_07930 [Candidatus Competibacteraceae bacterium]
MLIIRREQMDRLGQQMEKVFAKRMVTYLRDAYPERTQKVDDERLAEVVQHGIEKAQSHNVEYEDDIRRFLDYMMLYGPKMDSQSSTSWIGNILRRADLDGTEKMDLLDECELKNMKG